MKSNWRKKAQSTAEYVMLFAIVVGGITLATSYVKKALAGKVQAVTDGFLKEANSGNAELYVEKDPEQIYRASRGTRNQAQKESMDKDGITDDGVKAQSKNAVITGDLQEAVAAVNGHTITPTWTEDVEVGNGKIEAPANNF